MSSQNILTLDSVVFLSYLITGYDIEFSRLIRYDFYEREFREFTTPLFPYLVQWLCDAYGVSFISKVHQRIKVTHMEDIGMIKDLTNQNILN